MMHIDFDTYTLIADLLMMTDANNDFIHSVDDVAKIVGVDVDTVRYVDRAENDIF